MFEFTCGMTMWPAVPSGRKDSNSKTQVGEFILSVVYSVEGLVANQLLNVKHLDFV